MLICENLWKSASYTFLSHFAYRSSYFGF